MASKNEPNKEPTFEELMAKADNGQLSGDDMQKILNDYAQSVREEFEVTVAASPENAEEAKRDFCRNHMAHAMAQIHWLTIHAESESVKLSACKFIADGAIKEANKDGDPIAEIMRQLTGTVKD